jgi:hypothetical protein
MRRWIPTILALILPFVMIRPASSQGLFPVLGAERAGTASMTFLKIGVGARAEGMAGAFVAVADDPSCLYWNPAGLVRMRWKSGALFNFLQWPAQVQYSYLGWVHDLGHNQAIGFFAAALTLPKFEETTETAPHGTGRYVSYDDWLFGASYARALTQRFSAGVTLKYARETLDDLAMHAYLADVGTLYYTGLKDVRLAASLQHFGPNMRPSGTYATATGSSKYADYPPPTLFRLGVAGSAFRTPQHGLLLALALEHPIDNAENLSLGAEYTFRDMVALRAGRHLNRGEETWTAGLGVRFPFAGMNIELDYAYTSFGVLDLAQRFSSQLLYDGKR